jgi:PAS domain S-box-containing protein
MSKENEQGKPPAARGKGAAAENFNALDSEIAQYWLSALIESAGDAIVSKTLDGIVTSWNNGAERIFGYTAAEMIGRPILTLIPPERHGEEREILGKIRAGRRVEHYETIRRRKDGTLINGFADQGQGRKNHRRVENRARRHAPQADGRKNSRQRRTLPHAF